MMESEIASGPDRCCDPVTLLDRLSVTEAFALAMVIGDEENIESRVV